MRLRPYRQDSTVPPHVLKVIRNSVQLMFRRRGLFFFTYAAGLRTFRRAAGVLRFPFKHQVWPSDKLARCSLDLSRDIVFSAHGFSGHFHSSSLAGGMVFPPGSTPLLRAYRPSLTRFWPVRYSALALDPVPELFCGKQWLAPFPASGVPCGCAPAGLRPRRCRCCRLMAKHVLPDPLCSRCDRGPWAFSPFPYGNGSPADRVPRNRAHDCIAVSGSRGIDFLNSAGMESPNITAPYTGQRDPGMRNC